MTSSPLALFLQTAFVLLVICVVLATAYTFPRDNKVERFIFMAVCFLTVLVLFTLAVLNITGELYVVFDKHFMG